MPHKYTLTEQPADLNFTKDDSSTANRETQRTLKNESTLVHIFIIIILLLLHACLFALKETFWGTYLLVYETDDLIMNNLMSA